MIRSRLLFLTLLLAYLGMTPAGVYTCACFIPGQPVLEQADWEHLPEQPLLPDTAVFPIMSFLSLSLFLVMAVAIFNRFVLFSACMPIQLRPHEFKNLPLTPPPQPIQIV